MKESPREIKQITVIEHWEEREDGVYRIWEFITGATYEVKTPYKEIPMVVSPFSGQVESITHPKKGWGTVVKLKKEEPDA